MIVALHLPLPSGKIPIISAGQSEAGTRFAVEHADYNFRSGGGVNEPTRVAESVGRLVIANEAAGTQCGALVLTMIIADETDAAAMAKWEHYKIGTDFHRGDRVARLPVRGRSHGRSIGWAEQTTHAGYSGVADTRERVDWLACLRCPHAGRTGVGAGRIPGVMLTFDDFISGMEQFGTRIWCPCDAIARGVEPGRVGEQRPRIDNVTARVINGIDLDAWPRDRRAAGAVGLSRDITGKLHAAHDTVEWPGIIQRDVLRAPVVPERQRAGLPAKPAGEFGTVTVFSR